MRVFFIELSKWTNIWFFWKLRCLLTLACSNNCFAKQWFIELYEKKVRAQGVTEILRTILYGFFSSNSLVNKEFCVDFVNKEIFSLLNFFSLLITMNVLNSSINTFFLIHNKVCWSKFSVLPKYIYGTSWLYARSN